MTSLWWRLTILRALALKRWKKCFIVPVNFVPIWWNEWSICEIQNKNNLLSGLAQAEQQQHRLSVDALLRHLLLLLSAGNETTTCLLSNGIA